MFWPTNELFASLLSLLKRGATKKLPQESAVTPMMTSHKHQYHHGLDSSMRPSRPPVRVDADDDGHAGKKPKAKKVSTVSRAAARRASGFVMSPKVWRSFKREQKVTNIVHFL